MLLRLINGASMIQVCSIVEVIRVTMLCVLSIATAGWSLMTSLKVLDASYNQIVGAVIGFLSDNIQQLYLDNNMLSGNIPFKYGSTPNLRCWSLDHNPQICGVPPAGARCFDLTGTNIGG
jgi:hypothetical protein